MNESQLPFKPGDIVLVAMSSGNCMAGVFMEGGSKPLSMTIMRSGGDIIVVNGSYVASVERLGRVPEESDVQNDGTESTG